jgi:hypothetical protein
LNNFISEYISYFINRGGKTKKLIDYLAPRHPYRFRLRVILRATAVPTLADRAIEHYGDEAQVIDSLKNIVDPEHFKEGSNDGNNGQGDVKAK